MDIFAFYTIYIYKGFKKLDNDIIIIDNFFEDQQYLEKFKETIDNFPTDGLWVDVYHKEIADHPKFHFIEGGASRAESVKKGVDFLDSENLTFNNILIHDPVRPCLTKAELKRMLTEFCDSAFQALILAVPVSDTLKLSENNHIQSTISRENVWRALTPQLFTKEALKNAYNLNLKDLSNLTDEASLFDNLEEEVMIMQGSSENIKITFQEDLKLAKNILINQMRIKK